MEILIAFLIGGVTGSLLMFGIVYLGKTYDATCLRKRNKDDCEKGKDGYCGRCHADWYG